MTFEQHQLNAMTNEQLEQRLNLLMTVIRSAQPSALAGPPSTADLHQLPPAAPMMTDDAAANAYAAVLEQRRIAGNGHS